MHASRDEQKLPVLLHCKFIYIKYHMYTVVPLCGHSTGLTLPNMTKIFAAATVTALILLCRTKGHLSNLAIISWQGGKLIRRLLSTDYYREKLNMSRTNFN